MGRFGRRARKKASPASRDIRARLHAYMEAGNYAGARSYVENELLPTIPFKERERVRAEFEDVIEAHLHALELAAAL